MCSAHWLRARRLCDFGSLLWRGTVMDRCRWPQKPAARTSGLKVKHAASVVIEEYAATYSSDNEKESRDIIDAVRKP
jgi:hypothetical protein